VQNWPLTNNSLQQLTLLISVFISCHTLATSVFIHALFDVIFERRLHGILRAALVACELDAIVDIQMQFQRIGLHKGFPAVLKMALEGLVVVVDALVTQQIAGIVELLAADFTFEALLANFMDEHVRIESAAVLEHLPAVMTHLGAICVDVVVVECEVTFEIEKSITFRALDGIFETLSLVFFPAVAQRDFNFLHFLLVKMLLFDVFLIFE
jgi:hypothetical protein